MILAIFFGCLCLFVAHTFNHILWLCIILIATASILFVGAQSAYEKTIKRIEKLERGKAE